MIGRGLRKDSASGRPYGQTPHGSVEAIRPERPVARPSREEGRSGPRSRFGGLDPWGVLAGLTAAVGSLVALSTLLAAVGASSADQTDRESLAAIGVVAGIVALALALLFGGYVAGRVARYSGLVNGVVVGVLFVALTAALAALAARAGAEAQIGVPQWLDTDTATTAGIVTAVVALAVVLGSSALGGRLGSGWHRKVDGALAGGRHDDRTAPYPTEPRPSADADTEARLRRRR
jgi:hypothetical protein